MVKIGVIKTGNIASSIVLELLLDERADRKDISVRVAASGAKMSLSDVEGLPEEILKDNPDLILYATPNPAAPGPQKVIEKLAGKRAIVIGDAPGIKVKDKLQSAGIGYIFVKADSMIGARREFLDATEMVLFNADMLKVLSVTGAVRALQEEMDKAIEAVKNKSSYLPQIVLYAAAAIDYSGIKNPYARAKAMAAYEMAEKVGEVNIKACFVVKEVEKYVPLVVEAHELLRCAAKLCDEVREIEKAGDDVLRKPHSSEGKVLSKRRLGERLE